MKNIALIGFMGSGKTTVGKLVADIMKINFVDTDQRIEDSSGLTVSEIFESQGEQAFRDLETQVVLTLSNRNNLVISYGGGAVIREENRLAIKKSSKVFLLIANPDTILSRINGTHSRPLITSNKQFRDQIIELLDKRKEFYKATMDYGIQTDERTPEDIASDIVRVMKDGSHS